MVYWVNTSFVGAFVWTASVGGERPLPEHQRLTEWVDLQKDKIQKQNDFKHMNAVSLCSMWQTGFMSNYRSSVLLHLLSVTASNVQEMFERETLLFYIYPTADTKISSRSLWQKLLVDFICRHHQHHPGETNKGFDLLDLDLGGNRELKCAVVTVHFLSAKSVTSCNSCSFWTTADATFL